MIGLLGLFVSVWAVRGVRSERARSRSGPGGANEVAEHTAQGVPVRSPAAGTPVPLPGSDEAIRQGCMCPQIDNHYGEGFGAEPHFIYTLGCPLHGWEHR